VDIKEARVSQKARSHVLILSGRKHSAIHHVGQLGDVLNLIRLLGVKNVDLL